MKTIHSARSLIAATLIAALLVLGWFGIHVDIGKRLNVLSHRFSATEKGSTIPTPISTSLDSVMPAVDKNLDLAQQGGTQ